MKKLNFSKLPEHVRGLIRDIGALADESGVSAWLVGGMVRDLLLGHSSVDIDVVVEGDGMAFADLLARRLRGKALIHRRFGTAAIDLPSGLKVDVVTARRESYARPGMLPDVVFGHIADDTFRRDFTVNAIAASLNKDDFAVLRDDFDGIEDLQAGLVRIMHYRSFVDDPTRILRAVRYEKRFDFRLEPRTLAALKTACLEDAFVTITPVRYFNEFKKILEEADPLASLRRLRSLDGLRYFSLEPETEKLLAKVIRAQENTDLFKPTECAVWIPRLAGLLSFLEPARAQELLALFNIPRADKKLIQQFLHFLSVPDMLVRLRQKETKK